MFRRCASITAIIGTLLAYGEQASAEVTGAVEVLDGDTVEMLGQTIRLYGIDALEANQMCLSASGRPWPCGQEATASLRSFVGGSPLRCEPIANFGGTIQAACTLSGRDVGAWMVANGWAFADRSVSGDYLAQEAQAESMGAGVWDSTYVMPWEYRAGKRLEMPEFDQSKPVEENSERQNTPLPSATPSYGPLNAGP
ncbi:MAG: thermonuclease family protein [Alphaproteobacteria bacterium]